MTTLTNFVSWQNEIGQGFWMFVPGGANDRNDALVQQLAESFREGAWDSDLGTGQGNKTRPLLAAICVASHLIHIYIYIILYYVYYIY